MIVVVLFLKKLYLFFFKKRTTTIILKNYYMQTERHLPYIFKRKGKKYNRTAVEAIYD
jgi:hypothetical protein